MEVINNEDRASLIPVYWIEGSEIIRAPQTRLQGIRIAIYDCCTGKRFDRSSTNKVNIFNISFKINILRCIQGSTSPASTFSVNRLIDYLLCWILTNLARFGSAICCSYNKLKFTIELLVAVLTFNQLLGNSENGRIFLYDKSLHNVIVHQRKLSRVT